MLIELLVLPSPGKSTNVHRLLRLYATRGLAITGLTFDLDYRLKSSGTIAVKAEDLYEQIATSVSAASKRVWSTPRTTWRNLMKSVLERLQAISILPEPGGGRRVANRLQCRALDPEIKWAKSKVETVASKSGTRLVPLITVASDHPAQIRSTAATVRAYVMAHLAKQEYSSLPKGLIPPNANALTARQSSAPELSLQTEPCL
jgi:hypothetical protein